MSALLVSVLGSSLIGSLHCAAMCGPLQGLYLDPSWSAVTPPAPGRSPAAPGSPTAALGDAGPASRRLRWQAPLAHALGRLAAYAALGVAAGALGVAIDLAGDLARVQRAAMIVAGLALVLWGALALALALGAPVPTLRPRLWKQAVVRIRRRRPRTRAALLGLLSAALPCGWLWAFVVVAAGTGAPLGGALVMTAFWAGTVPMMLGLGAVAGPLVARVGRRMPLVTAAVLIAVGVVALSARVPLLDGRAVADAAAAPGEVPIEPACHRSAP